MSGRVIVVPNPHNLKSGECVSQLCRCAQAIGQKLVWEYFYDEATDKTRCDILLDGWIISSASSKSKRDSRVEACYRFQKGNATLKEIFYRNRRRRHREIEEEEEEDHERSRLRL